MSDSELNEHAGYLTDTHKLAAYEQALRVLLADRRAVVLDLGAGSGILGLLAARAGAGRVYAVDSGPIIGPAAEVAFRSEYASSVVQVRGRSTEIELPELVDVAVCDQIGGFVHDAGVLEYFADARRRLLAPGGVLVPARFTLALAPVECDRVREQLSLWASTPAGFDFSPFAELAVNTEHRVGGNEVRVLGPGVQIGVIESDHTDPIKGEGAAVVADSGRCDGLVGWFTAELGGGATLTNQPESPVRMQRWCNVYPLSEGVEVEPGDVVEVSIDVRPLLRAVTWRVTVTAGDGQGEKIDERHSTLLGQFLAPDDLERSRGVPIEATGIGNAVARALELADGSRSTEEIMMRVGAEFPAHVSSPLADRALRDLLGRFSTVSSQAHGTRRA